MSTRLYDYILTVNDTTPFKNGNNIIGASSETFGYVANVDPSTSNIKVKVANAFQEFTVGESVYSNHYLLSNVVSIQSFAATSSTEYVTLTGLTIPTYATELSVYVNEQIAYPNDWTYHEGNNKIQFFDSTLPGQSTIKVFRQTGNTNAFSFASSTGTLIAANAVQSSSATISAINVSPFIRARHAFTQPPVVRLYTFYYPGEWYPPNENGNPSGEGAGYAWPVDMPWRIAEVIGDNFSDLTYNVSFAGESYLPYPVESSGISTSSDGSIDRVSISVSNYDNVVTTLVENPYLVGNVTSNSCHAMVNGEMVWGLDPATVVGNVHFNQDVVDSYYGTTNSAWGYSRAQTLGEDWEQLKYDTRDFLGGVVEIKSTFATHLEYWPEHSSIDYISGNVISVVNAAPYRVGDNVKNQFGTATRTIQDIQEERILFLSAPLANAAETQNLYIVNDDYDPEAYVKDVFKILEMPTLNEQIAEFTLTSWLQYFKLRLPKRKFYKNTCQWEYKGTECQYPGPPTPPAAASAIPGTFPTRYANTNPIFANNTIAASIKDDECGKSYEACRVRNNTIHFGGFPGTGRQVPKQ